MTQKQRSGPRHHAKAAPIEYEDQRTARAFAGPPCAGRYLWSVTVLTCPWCGTLHTHRVGETSRLLSGRVTKMCPVLGRPYLLSPVQRRKEARRV